MADITMCRNFMCSIKNKCYRYMAKADRFRQSYFFVDPVGGEDCESFLEIETHKK